MTLVYSRALSPLEKLVVVVVLVLESKVVVGGGLHRMLLIAFKIQILIVDINECAQGQQVCPYNSECVNTIGGAFCVCRPGYELRRGKCRGIK